MSPVLPKNCLNASWEIASTVATDENCFSILSYFEFLFPIGLKDIGAEFVPTGESVRCNEPSQAVGLLSFSTLSLTRFYKTRPGRMVKKYQAITT
jgi:hypothetical protein